MGNFQVCALRGCWRTVKCHLLCHCHVEATALYPTPICNIFTDSPSYVGRVSNGLHGNTSTCSVLLTISHTPNNSECQTRWWMWNTNQLTVQRCELTQHSKPWYPMCLSVAEITYSFVNAVNKLRCLYSLPWILYIVSELRGNVPQTWSIHCEELQTGEARDELRQRGSKQYHSNNYTKRVLPIFDPSS